MTLVVAMGREMMPAKARDTESSWFHLGSTNSTLVLFPVSSVKTVFEGTSPPKVSCLPMALDSTWGVERVIVGQTKFFN